MNGFPGGVRRIFLDSAPVIYFVEEHPVYYPLLQPIFQRLETQDLIAVTSPITLAECLVFPMRSGRANVIAAFVEILGGGPGACFVTLGRETAILAARVRSRRSITLTDAFQVAAALEGRCDVFLTNDKALTKIDEIRVALVDDL